MCYIVGFAWRSWDYSLGRRMGSAVGKFGVLGSIMDFLLSVYCPWTVVFGSRCFCFCWRLWRVACSPRIRLGHP